MEKYTPRGTSRYYFAKMHERVQNKYEEMQRKLQKSKSMDSLHLPTDNEEIVLNGINSEHNVSDYEITLKVSEKSSQITNVSINEDMDLRSIYHNGFEYFPKDDSFSGLAEIHDDNISIFSHSNMSIES